MSLQTGINEIFSRTKAIILDDHFVYAKKPDGWYHGRAYVNKDAIYPHVGELALLCREIANHFFNRKIEIVVGPAIGAVCLAQWVAYHLGYQVLAIYADEEDVLEQKQESMGTVGFREFLANGLVKIEGEPDHLGSFGSLVKIAFSTKVGTRRILRRGYDKLVVGKRCLIVEDVINSGATVAKTIKAVSDADGIIAGVGCLCNRSGGKVNTATLGITELFSLLDLNMEMFREEDCPICKERGTESVRTDLGKGKEFLARIGRK
jgi:orotate phosphoribosyltransferase